MAQVVQNQIMKILLYQDRINIRRILLNIYTKLELIEGQLCQNTSFSKAGQLLLGEWNTELIITQHRCTVWDQQFLFNNKCLYFIPKCIFLCH